MAKQELDAYTLRWCADWHRRQFLAEDMPLAWEAHLVSSKHFRTKARALTKPPSKRSKRRG